jgi:DeoR family transcriptional regulator, fructose operon transcriptional repressor
MNFQVRKQYILSVLEQKGSIEVKELAQQLNTSEITIRRDLAILAEKGLLVRTHGGAVTLSVAKDPIHFNNKAATRQEQKEYIGRLAASQIQEGDTVFIDCGSTTFQLCPFVRHLNIRVITNSLPVVDELMGSSVGVNIMGGEVDAGRRAVHGFMAIEHLNRYRVDKAFIGVDGLSLKYGLSAHSEKEASITLAAATNAGHVYLLCDSSKLENDKYFRFAPLSIVHTLVTDQLAPAELLDQYTRRNLQVLN